MSIRISSILLLGFVSILILGCSFGKKIKTGEMAYESKQYSVAVDMLAQEYEKSDNSRNQGRQAYLLGMSYSYLEEDELAINWLENAVKKGYGNEALIALAKASKKIGDYAAAIQSYEQLKKNSNSTRYIDREIFVLQEVAKWANEVNPNIQIELVNENSGFSEYSPALLDKNFLVFTSDRNESSGGDLYKWTGNKHSDLFVMLKNGSNIKRFDASINSPHNDGTACFTKDGLEMVFSRCFTNGNEDSYCKLMYSERYSGIWSEPKILPFMKEEINYGQPTFIENDSVLVFAAEIVDGFGGHDLYYSEKVYNGDGGFDWGEPFIFPQTINSSGNEMFPSGDGDTLYFSSDFFAGLGGLDIFKTWLQPNGEWAPPQNLKKPINSSYDDFGLIVDKNAELRGNEIQKGFFSSTRKGYGKEDLYRFSTKQAYTIETVPPLETEEEEKVAVEIYLAGKTKEILYNEGDNPNSGRKGKGDLAECYIVIDDGQKQQKIYSDDKGQFIVKLERDKKYSVKGSKIGYLNDIKNISTTNLIIEKGALSTTVNVELILNRIFSNVEINLENIYYNFNRWDIREDAKPTLDSLTLLLVNNPQIKVQLSSHTDCRGDDEYNEILSQKRAESVVSYIVSKGVSKAKMLAKGYGEGQPAENCECDSCTEEQHQTNRRTTFKILE